MARCAIAAMVFFGVAFLCLIRPHLFSQVGPMKRVATVEESYDTGHALLKRLTKLVSNKQVFLLHAAKTGGRTSNVFAANCANISLRANILLKAAKTNDTCTGLLNNTPERVVASHINRFKEWSRLLRCLTEDAVVFVTVRPFDSWYRSAVMHVATRNCVAKPKCRVQGRACVITPKVLQRFTEKKEYELSMDLGQFFSAVEKLKNEGLLRTRIFLVDIHYLDVLHNVISRQFCPTVTAIKKNDHVEKAPVFLDSVDINGTCAEMSANVSRSQVDLLSLNSTSYEGWQADSIPTRVFEEGFWVYP